MTIIEALEDSELFGALIKDQSTWANWKVFLKALFCLPMDEAELSAFREFTGRNKPPMRRPNEAYCICGRRGGKSFIAAITAVYLAVFHDWTPYLSPGERGWVMCIAVDRQQAKVILHYIRAVLALPMFKGKVRKELSEEIELDNIVIAVKTCDFRSLRGFTTVCVLLDELAYYRDQGANPADEILVALRPSLGTIPGSLMIGLSSPYGKFGPLYESFRDNFGKDDSDTLVWKAPTLAMNPGFRKSTVEAALKKDFTAAKREYLAEFSEGLSVFLPTEMIESAVVPGRYELPKVEGAVYHAFTDLSGGRVDSATAAIAHKDRETGKIILDRLEERKPPFAPQAIIQEFANIFKRYGIGKVIGDRYAGEFVSRGYQEAGIQYVPSRLDRSGIYLEFEPLLAQGQLELLDNKTLFAQLRGLERTVRSGGKDRVDHYAGAHDDCANSVAGACIEAAAVGNYQRHFFWLDRNTGRVTGGDPLRTDNVDARFSPYHSEAFMVRWIAALRVFPYAIDKASDFLRLDKQLMREFNSRFCSKFDYVAAVRKKDIAELAEQFKTELEAKREGRSIG